MEQWISDPSKVGATALLVMAVIAFAKGYIVPRWTYDAALATLEKELTRALADVQLHKDMNMRLLSQLERNVSIAEITADAAAQAATRKP